MLVYGDPQFLVEAIDFLHFLQRQAIQIHPSDLDGLRALMIQIGQFEQGWSDVLDNADPQLQVTQELTDLAAAAFYQAWLKGGGTFTNRQWETSPALPRLCEKLDAYPTSVNRVLTVKVPEGFEFYTLYPEQYALAAAAWATSYAQGSGNVLVMGLRSIGTTLSALVNTTIQACGWETRRMTVRPTGPPFERTVALGNANASAFRWALVVDEGPGMSGSSMAAVAATLAEAGMDPKRITFLPGHGDEPGTAATPAVRRWWNEVERRVIPLDAVQWDGKGLSECLAAKLIEWRNSGEKLQMADCGGGLWRQWAYQDPAEWPAVATPFERSKYLFTSPSGENWIWKFTGLGALVEPGITGWDMHRENTTRPDTSPALSVMGGFLGFACWPWLKGSRLHAHDAQAGTVLDQIGSYVLASSGPPLGRDEHLKAIHRLAEILYWNTQKSLGDEWAALTVPWVEMAQASNPGPSYTDGHLDPHEWVRTLGGKIVKTDTAGHTTDHTMVGRQSWLWDLAGAVVTWELDDQQTKCLLTLAEQASRPVAPDVLQFYKLAFIAFRLGQATLCANMGTAAADDCNRWTRTQEKLAEHLKASLRLRMRNATGASGF